MSNLPNIMYFSSKDKFNIIKPVNGRLFLSPYIGISSMFIIDRHAIMNKMITDKLGRTPRNFTYNIAYDEWTSKSDKELMKPLLYVHMTHNIKQLTDTLHGSSYGYIYKIDVSHIKEELELFVTNDSNRELVYRGNEKFKPVEVIPHSLDWTINFSQETANKHGYGRFR